jgi:hypothetical protein
MRKYYTESRRRGILLLKRRKANWVSNIMRGKYLLKHFTGGKIAGRIKKTGRRGRRHKQLLDNLKETR